MEENKVNAQPQEENRVSDNPGEHQSDTGENSDTVSVKFNKEIKNLTADEAAALAQKGMKFEMIEKDFLKLRTLAAREKKSVSEFLKDIEQKRDGERMEELLKASSGNKELARHVMELEDRRGDDEGLEELKEYFPTVRSLEDLPRAVVETARLKGENLLKSYLTYRLIKKRQSAEESAAEKAAGGASVGSLKNKSASVEDDFIKALWGR